MSSILNFYFILLLLFFFTVIGELKGHSTNCQFKMAWGGPWSTHAIPALGSLRHEDHRFQTGLLYTDHLWKTIVFLCFSHCSLSNCSFSLTAKAQREQNTGGGSSCLHDARATSQSQSTLSLWFAAVAHSDDLSYIHGNNVTLTNIWIFK